MHYCAAQPVPIPSPVSPITDKTKEIRTSQFVILQGLETRVGGIMPKYSGEEKDPIESI